MSRYLQNNKIVDQPTFDEAEVGSQQYVMSSDSVIVPMIRSLGLTRDSEFVGQPKMGGARISDYIGDIKKAIAGLFGMRVLRWMIPKLHSNAPRSKRSPSA